ncbi:hypothetical protein [Streptomyces sp. NBC_01217]|uniref:hypothetical protein n=1 Tax=Streptomyces sp. NBC_01217 TaxID=2903779 RepID=UPI002E14655B|nr:hypothetical protein OG507_02330 [Streptomyces sp. NBC_01217]
MPITARRRGPYLAVPDFEAARAEPARRDYASFAELADPDGNARTLQEHGFRRS